MFGTVHLTELCYIKHANSDATRSIKPGPAKNKAHSCGRLGSLGIEWQESILYTSKNIYSYQNYEILQWQNYIQLRKVSAVLYYWY